MVVCPTARPRTQGINGHVSGVPVTIHFYFFFLIFLTWTLSFRQFTTALKATGKTSPPSKRSPLLQKFPKWRKKWLIRQALRQIYFPAPKHIARPKFDVPTPNGVHQEDLLFLPHDRVGRGRNRKTYKYALTVVDVASRFKEAELLTSKE